MPRSIADDAIRHAAASDELGDVNMATWTPRALSNETLVKYNLSRLAVPTGEPIDSGTVLVGLILHSYYTPAIVVVGSIGNILSVVVFFRLKLRKLSSSFYLAALGISDTIFLLTNSSTWITTDHLGEYGIIEIVCKLSNYLCGVSSVLSSWFVVAFTVERFIAVLYPLKRQTMCTVRRARVISLALLAGGLLHCLPLLYYFGYSPTMESCAVESEVSLMNIYSNCILIEFCRF